MVEIRTESKCGKLRISKDFPKCLRSGTTPPSKVISDFEEDSNIRNP
jgi:hypothetical protein